jgi:hypothetical protein
MNKTSCGSIRESFTKIRVGPTVGERRKERMAMKLNESYEPQDIATYSAGTAGVYPPIKCRRLNVQGGSGGSVKEMWAARLEVCLDS